MQLPCNSEVLNLVFGINFTLSNELQKHTDCGVWLQNGGHLRALKDIKSV